ncbi:MAG: urease accessory protein UreD [Deinococcota bacterium]
MITPIPSSKSPSTQGEVKLTISLRDGVSVVSQQYSHAPLKVMRPFQLADGSLLLQLLSVGPGMLAGDCYQIDIEVQPGASAVIVNQAASKVLTMPAGQSAEQHVTLTVAEGASLEYYPGTTLPYPAATLSQTITAQVSSDGALGILESWAMGRVARGELFEFTSLTSHTRVYQGSRLTYQDSLWLEPHRQQPSSWGLLEGYSYLSSGYWSPDYWSRKASPEAINTNTPDLMLARGQDHIGGVYIRALARDSVFLGQALREQLDGLRSQTGRTALNWQVYSSAL